MSRSRLTINTAPRPHARQVDASEENETTNVGRREHHHQFGDFGTIAMVNQSGELMSMSQSLLGPDGEAKFIVVEKREMVVPDVKHPQRTLSTDYNSTSDDDSESSDTEETAGDKDGGEDVPDSKDVVNEQKEAHERKEPGRTQGMNKDAAPVTILVLNEDEKSQEKKIEDDNKEEVKKLMEEQDKLPDNDISSYSPFGQARYKGYGKLYITRNTGIGLRLAKSCGKIQVLSTRYRDDRWPIVKMSTPELKVVVRYVIVRGKLLQQYTITSTADSEKEYAVDINLTAALRRTLAGTVKIGHGHDVDFRHSVRKTADGMIVLDGPHGKLSMRVFKGADTFDLTGIEVKTDISTLSTEEICHKEKFQLKPKETVTFTAVYALTNSEDTVPILLADEESKAQLMSNGARGRWWKFKEEAQSTSFQYRRTLAHLVTVQAIPLFMSPEKYPNVAGVQPYTITDGCIDPVHHSVESHPILEFLFGMYQLLDDISDPDTASYYKKQIRDIAKGFIWWYWTIKGPEKPSDDFLRTDGLEIEEYDENGLINKDPEDPWSVKAGYALVREPMAYARRIAALRDFLLLFPDEKGFVGGLFSEYVPEYWKSITKAVDKTSDLVVEISPAEYRGMPTQSKKFDLADQILRWKAAEATVQLLEQFPEIRTDDITRLEDAMQPDATRTNIIEKFKVEKPGTIVSNGTVREIQHTLLATSRSNASPNETNSDVWYSRHLVCSPLNRDFFCKDSEATSRWAETMRLQDTTRWDDPWNFTTQKMINAITFYLLAPFRSVDEDGRRALRRDIEELTSANGHMLYVSYFNADWHPVDLMNMLFFNDFTKELGYKPMLPIDATQAQIPASAITPVDGTFRALHGDVDQQEPQLQAQQQKEARPQQQAATKRKTGHRNARGGPGARFQKQQMLTLEDRRFLNENPEYGPPWLFTGPLFFIDHERARPKLENFQDLKKRMLESYDWRTDWIFMSEPELEPFIKRLTEEDVSAVTRGAPPMLIDFGDKKAWSYPLGDGTARSVSYDAVQKFFKPRDHKLARKRWVIAENCLKGFVCPLLATHNDGEARELARFIQDSIVSCKATKEFDTNNNEGFWITEVSVSYIEIMEDSMSKADRQKGFPFRSSLFTAQDQSTDPIDLRESSIGFRIIGDIHDRHWTCYFLTNNGHISYSEWNPLVFDHIAQKSSELKSSLHQRKVLEAYLVSMMLDTVKKQIEVVLAKIDDISSPDKNSLFDRNETGTSSEHTFRNRFKHSVLYPRLIEILNLLKENMDATKAVAESFLDAESSFGRHKPRWSAGDQRKYGKIIRDLQKTIREQIASLKVTKSDMEGRIEWFKNLKEWIASDLSLQDARRSVILSESARIFTVVTLIYLPLTFASSLVAIDGISWGTPVEGLFKIIGIVSAGTILILVNLDFIDRQFQSFISRAYKFLQKKMVYRRTEAATSRPVDEESTIITPILPPEPKFTFWTKKAEMLKIMDTRKEMLGEGQSDFQGTSSWWYWGFLVFYTIVKLPMTELAWAVRTTWVSNVRRIGPLQRLVRLPWIPLWIVILVLVYLLLVIWGAFVAVLKGIGAAFRWGWYGTLEREGRRKEGGEMGVLRKMLYAMEWELVEDAYRARSLPMPPKKVEKEEMGRLSMSRSERTVTARAEGVETGGEEEGSSEGKKEEEQGSS